MAPVRKSKASVKEEGSRTSPRKKQAEKVHSTPIISDIGKTPKRCRSKLMPDRTPKSSLFDSSFNSPSTSFANNSSSSRNSAKDEKKTCAFYQVKRSDDGTLQFNKSLIRYFMTCDSPEMEDLKAGRRNTSFLREIPRPRDIQIYSPEEDKDPKWLENVPHIESNLPEVPGSDYADLFKSLPIDSDSDEESQRFTKKGNSTKAKSNSKKPRKSTRCSTFTGKPLPDDALLFDYSGLFDSDCNGEENNQSLQNSSDEESSILHSLLSSPSAAFTRPSNSTPKPYNNVNYCQKKDDLLLRKYKDLLGDKVLRVSVKKLPLTDESLKSFGVKKLNSTACFNGKKESGVKKHADRRLIKSKIGVSELQKKNHPEH